MQQHYARADYFEGGESGYDCYASQEEALRATFRRLLDAMSRRGMCGGSVLDVGCGYGYFLQEAAAYFSNRLGTDYSEGALDRARRHADAVYLGGADDVPVELQQDCIVALHVVEHVYDPRRFVAELFRRLKPGGTLLLAAPNMGSWWRHAMGRRWPSFKYPEHVAYYDRRTLQQLMATVVPESLQSIPYPHAFPVNLVLQKLRLPRLDLLNGRSMWLPATTVAIAARKPGSNARRAAA
jgi:2-polyprenyl-3-methyl-5-hydroxy-6-metoxy-1,4-benzoquinol methylase